MWNKVLVILQLLLFAKGQQIRWTLIGNYSYYISTSSNDFINASLICQSYKSELLEVTTNNEHVAISRLLNKAYRYWVGLQVAANGDILWTKQNTKPISSLIKADTFGVYSKGYYIYDNSASKWLIAGANETEDMNYICKKDRVTLMLQASIAENSNMTMACKFTDDQDATMVRFRNKGGRVIGIYFNHPKHCMTDVHNPPFQWSCYTASVYLVLPPSLYQHNEEWSCEIVKSRNHGDETFYSQQWISIYVSIGDTVTLNMSDVTAGQPANIVCRLLNIGISRNINSIGWRKVDTPPINWVLPVSSCPSTMFSYHDIGCRRLYSTEFLLSLSPNRYKQGDRWQCQFGTSAGATNFSNIVEINIKGTSYDVSTHFLSASYDASTTFIDASYDVGNQFIYTSYDVNTQFLDTPYDPRTQYLDNSYDVSAQSLDDSSSHLQIGQQLHNVTLLDSSTQTEDLVLTTQPDLKTIALQTTLPLTIVQTTIVPTTDTAVPRAIVHTTRTTAATTTVPTTLVPKSKVPLTTTTAIPTTTVITPIVPTTRTTAATITEPTTTVPKSKVPLTTTALPTTPVSTLIAPTTTTAVLTTTAPTATVPTVTITISATAAPTTLVPTTRKTEPTIIVPTITISTTAIPAQTVPATTVPATTVPTTTVPITTAIQITTVPTSTVPTTTVPTTTTTTVPTSTVRTTTDIYKSSAMSHTTTVAGPGLCLCNCKLIRSLSDKELQEKINTLIKTLKIDAKKTNAARRKLKSENDERPVTKTIGTVAIGVLCTVFGLIFVNDLLHLWNWLKDG